MTLTGARHGQTAWILAGRDTGSSQQRTNETEHPDRRRHPNGYGQIVAPLRPAGERSS
jgi:hypothetical protein